MDATIELVHTDGRVWSTTHSGNIWHAFRLEGGQTVALCRKNIRPRSFATHHDAYYTLAKTEDFALTTSCERCRGKLEELERALGTTENEVEAPAEEIPERACERDDAHEAHVWFVRKGPVRAGRDFQCPGVPAAPVEAETATFDVDVVYERAGGVSCVGPRKITALNAENAEAQASSFYTDRGFRVLSARVVAGPGEKDTAYTVAVAYVLAGPGRNVTRFRFQARGHADRVASFEVPSTVPIGTPEMHGEMAKRGWAVEGELSYAAGPNEYRGRAVRVVQDYACQSQDQALLVATYAKTNG